MAKNKMSDLRDHLFEQLERLKDDEVDVEKEIKRSQAVVNVSNALINSAKVEVEMVRSLGGRAIPEGGFFNPMPEESRALPSTAPLKQLTNGKSQ